MKTFGNWTYNRPTLTTFVWTSPMGRIYVNDLTHKDDEPTDPHPAHHRRRGHSHVRAHDPAVLSGAVTTTVDPSRPAADRGRNHPPQPQTTVTTYPVRRVTDSDHGGPRRCCQPDEGLST